MIKYIHNKCKELVRELENVQKKKKICQRVLWHFNFYHNSETKYERDKSQRIKQDDVLGLL